MELLIDADLVAYRCAASAEHEEEFVAIDRVYSFMHGIFANVEHTDYKCYLTGGGNFRKLLYPLYKANRTQPKPRWLEKCREAIRLEFRGQVFDGIEADDAIGINAHAESIIVSNDKDFNQIPGWHFNPVTLELLDVSDYDAEFQFYCQFLCGDRSDNIVGVNGIGPKKAEKALYGLDPEEMFDKVRELYNDDQRFLLNGQMLHIMRYPYDIWTGGNLWGDLEKLDPTVKNAVSAESINQIQNFIRGEQGLENLPLTEDVKTALNLELNLLNTEQNLKNETELGKLPDIENLKSEL